jgi:HK97 family phage prohead protease
MIRKAFPHEVKLGRESKLVSMATMQLKFASDAGEGTFTGYGAVFGNVDSYGDVIAKGAFRDTLKEIKKTEEWPAMLLQHGGFTAEDNTPIGIWLDLEEDDYGLKVQGKLAIDTQRGGDIYKLMKMEPRPALQGLSIGYRAKEFELGTRSNEPRRTLKKIDLIEISPVTFAANTLARVDGVKGRPSERTFEQWLMRDAGFTAIEAKTIISQGFKALTGERDAVPGADGLSELVNGYVQRIRA